MGPTNNESEGTSSNLDTLQITSQNLQTTHDPTKPCSNRPTSTKVKVGKLQVLVLNFQSIRNKKEDLELMLSESDIDIVLGSETHLNQNITDNEFLHPLYKCYRRDRAGGHGGVIVITKADLIVEEIVKARNFEFLAVKIQTHSSPLIIATAHRPPNNHLKQAEHIARLTMI